MKLSNIFLMATVAALALAGCNRVGEGESDFDNKVYIQQAESKNSQYITLKSKDLTTSRIIQAALAKPQNSDVTVTCKADPALVEHYMQSTGTVCKALAADHYTLSSTQALITAGNVRSNDIQVNFSGLDQLTRNVNYVLPVTIQSSDGVGILESSRTIYYVLSQGATINYAVYMAENYFEIPTFATSPAVQGLKQVTFEALLRPHAWKSISSIMGIEEYFLIRMGDTFPQNAVQLATGSNSRGPDFAAGDWMHFACTYDISTKQLLWYVNGVLKQTSSVTFGYSTIDLGKNQKNSNAFYLGYSYTADRWFDGDMCEVRIWNVVRTQEQIADNIYEVEPDSEGLVAYWKFDEGSGAEVHDHTANGNHAVAKSSPGWIKIALPAVE